MMEPLFPLDRVETFADGLDHPEGIAVAPDGSLVVGGELGQVYRVAPDGAVEELLRTGGFMLGIALDGEGRIYAIDTGLKCVWRIDPVTRTREEFARGPAERPFANPNWGAFAADGTYYLSDSGGWGARDGLIWRVPPGAAPEPWCEASRNFPNGLALGAGDASLVVAESYPSALVEIEIRADGTAGERRVLCELGDVVPDGVALAVDGSVFVPCYRPDAIYRWHPDAGLELFAADPRGTILAAPTNAVFTGPGRDELVVPNIGRWHLARLRPGIAGVPLHYPTAEQLRS